MVLMFAALHNFFENPRSIRVNPRLKNPPFSELGGVFQCVLHHPSILPLPVSSWADRKARRTERGRASPRQWQEWGRRYNSGPRAPHFLKTPASRWNVASVFGRPRLC